MPQLVIIVSADFTVQEFLSEVIEIAGYRVAQAYSGEAALRLVDARTPSALLIDACIPLLDGRGVARELARRHIGVPVILMEDGANGEEIIPTTGMYAVLRKPFTTEELLAAIAGGAEESSRQQTPRRGQRRAR